MSRARRVPPADHAARAEEARRKPGEWVFVNSYGSTLAAKSVARFVKLGFVRGTRGNPYQPPGSFDAYVQLDDEGTSLYVRHIEAG